MKVLNSMEEMQNLLAGSSWVMLYVTSKSCSVCTVLYPQLAALTDRYPQVESAKMDIEELPMLSGEYGIFTVPCVLVFYQGREMLREARYINISRIDEQIQRYMVLLE